MGEETHLFVFLYGLHPSVYHTDTVVGKHFLQNQEFIFHIAQCHLVALLHQWEYEVCLTPCFYLRTYGFIQSAQVGVGNVQCAYGFASWRKLVDDRYVQVSVERHGQSARDGGGCHHQNVWSNGILGPQASTLGHTETVLLVDDS